MHLLKIAITTPCCLLCFTQLKAQTDSVNNLPEVTVKAFEQNRRLRDVGAAIHIVDRNTLQRFSPVSVVHAVNTAPGVRMEERSPGSYRLNIRGSSLRSPFGVRNVKTYFNDIPITDPGGHTYLNQLGWYNFGSIEIIKGPGSSIYGAGTGGVLLIESMQENTSGIFSEYARGSYNMQNIYGRVTTASENLVTTAGLQHQQSDGYRQHSRLQRDVFTWTANIKAGANTQIKTTFLYGNLFYQTPGALTKAEYETNPRDARPGNAFFPGAVTAQASISQKQLIAGASLLQQLAKGLDNKTVLYGMFTELRNPTIQNYGRSSEPHGGLRTTFNWKKPANNLLLQVQWGGEVQAGFTSVSIHKNVGGNADSLRTYDAIRSIQSMAFVQLGLESQGWIMTAGSSINFLNVRVQRFTPATLGPQTRNFSNGITPRVSLLKKIKAVNIYAAIAKGFSPPSTAELLPTGGNINLDLQAERGWNYEAGVKATFFRRLFVDINTFRFSLQNTIVQRRTAGGGDFFANAGSTSQYGIETYVSYPFLHQLPSMGNSLFWLSHTYHHFKYKSFKQITNDFSGNRMPATPFHTLSTGLDVESKKGWLATVTYYYSGDLPLNDANTEYATAYHLLGARLGYQRWFGTLRLKLVGGGENLLNQVYSLGNDINGFGGRYFNAAPTRNYYASLIVEWRKNARNL